MQRTLIIDALNAEKARNDITLCGWVRTRRDAKGFSFVEINDGSCLANMQCIVDEGTEAHAALGEANTGAALAVSGELVASPGKGQKWEVRAKGVTVFGLADPESFPLQKKRHTDEFLRGIAHLRARTNKYGAAFRIRSEAGRAVHDFFHGRRFAWVHTPVLTGSDCEGAGEMFRVTTLAPGEKNTDGDFFNRPCNLTVSGQLEAEALALGLGAGLHLRPHLPGRKLQYPAPCRRILDDRAGNGLRGPHGPHGTGRKPYPPRHRARAVPLRGGREAL